MDADDMTAVPTLKPTTTDELVLAALRSKRAILDVRAPSEFKRGSFPHAVNLPILTDEERRLVGITYKKDGHQAAVALGHQLVCGETKLVRVAAWSEFVLANPDALICCWRGGMRSALAAQWLHEAGHDCERVPGGFKAIRRAGLKLFDQIAEHSEWLIVGGLTGSGKTRVIQELDDAIDLERAANHRGSSFGARNSPQPTQVSFENVLAVEFARRRDVKRSAPRFVVEDEGRTIGRLALPEVLVQKMRRSPLVVIRAPLETRVTHIVADYIDAPLAEGSTLDELHSRYRDALRRLTRRLGDQRWRHIDRQMETAFSCNDHRPWIRSLLTDYYDATYSYQLAQKSDRVIFRGTADEVIAFVRSSRPNQEKTCDSG